MTTYTTFTEILEAAAVKGFKLVDPYAGTNLSGYEYVWMKDGKKFGNSIQASIPFNDYKAAMAIKAFVNPSMQEIMAYHGLD